MNGFGAPKDGGDGIFEFAGIFATTKDCIGFDGAEGELGIRAAAR